ncbi:MAG TPA: hypothetical protein VJ726_08000 [Candidatus Limnocylindria bacterium]|nr:hypothetical protein [Candidatus Limnocylindria bacterium]
MRTALGWTIATAVGFALVGLIPCNRERQELLFFGAVGSLPQALFLFLRARPGSALAWPVVTGVAVPLGYYFALVTIVVGSQAIDVPEILPWLIAGCVVAGITVGLMQSPVVLSLAFRPRAALRWVVASALGGPAAGAFLLTMIGLLVIWPDGRISFGDSSSLPTVPTVPTIPPTVDWGCDPGARPLLGLLLGAIYGAITGAVLERCLRDTAST